MSNQIKSKVDRVLRFHGHSQNCNFILLSLIRSQKSNLERSEESKSIYETCKSQELGPAHGTRTLCLEGFEGEGVAGML
jgi:hypothetical protein